MSTLASYSPVLANGTWTTYLPLTTAFSSPPQCTGLAWARDGIYPPSNFWPYVFDPAYGQSVANSVTCLPALVTAWQKASDAGATPGDDGVMTTSSLGPLVCPRAYKTVSTAVLQGSSTMVTCCPSDYGIATNLTNNAYIICSSTITSGQILVYAGPVGTGTDIMGYQETTTTWTSNGLMLAEVIKGLNFAVSTPAPVTTTAPTTGPSTSSPRMTSTPTGVTSTNAGTSLPSSASQNSTGLSGGAKAGIAIGAVAGALLLLGAAYLFWRRRAQMKTRSDVLHEMGVNEAAKAQSAPGELAGPSVRRKRNTPMGELDASPIAELQ